MNNTTVAPKPIKVTIAANQRCPAHCEHGYFYEGNYNGGVTNTLTCERCDGKGCVTIRK